MPQTAFTVEPIGRWWRGGFRLVGDFHPGEIYQVTFKEGCRRRTAPSLPKDLVRSVYVPRAEGGEGGCAGAVPGARGALAVPVAGANVERFTAQPRRGMPT